MKPYNLTHFGHSLNLFSPPYHWAAIDTTRHSISKIWIQNLKVDERSSSEKGLECNGVSTNGGVDFSYCQIINYSGQMFGCCPKCSNFILRLPHIHE